MKIGILVREDTMLKCTGKGCFNAFFKRIDAFSGYDEKAELLGFTHIGGDIDRKIEKMIENGVDTVHLSTCARAKAPEYEALAERLSKHFNVVGYTHGSEVGKTRETVFIKKSEE
ncbi:MAG: CGGC domain-containing protein [Clostridiaceae bacterium]